MCTLTLFTCVSLHSFGIKNIWSGWRKLNSRLLKNPFRDYLWVMRNALLDFGVCSDPTSPTIFWRNSINCFQISGKRNTFKVTQYEHILRVLRQKCLHFVTWNLSLSYCHIMHCRIIDFFINWLFNWNFNFKWVYENHISGFSAAF